MSLLLAAYEAVAFGWWDLLGLISIPTLVALNGFFVAAEFGLVAVRKTRIEQLVAEGVKRAQTVEMAIAHLDRYIAATQLGITLASLALGWLGERALEHLLTPWFEGWPYPWNLVLSHSVAGSLAFFFVTFLHVVFGELIPKTIALQTPDTVALFVASPLVLFTRLTRPLILLMNGTGNLILRWCGYQPASGEHLLHSVEELALLIEDTEEAGLLEPEQADIVVNVFKLSDKKVRDCMVPAERMAALELSLSSDKILEAVRTGAHTRMPVYEGALDNIVGIVNTKDLFYLFSLRGLVILADAMYPAIFLRPDEDLATALRLFQRSKRPMALVRDEDGKIYGVLTLEDVLEEIVGDIEDEHDRPTPRRMRRLRRPGGQRNQVKK